jgi:hypothetical protein
MKLFLVCCLIALSQAAICSAAEPGSPDALVGCYAVVVGAWQPPVELGRSAISLVPPAHIKLTRVRGTRGWANRHFIVVPILGATSQHQGIYWDVTPEHEVRVVFTNGFSGLTMSLRSTSAGLSGSATSFWDSGRPSQSASVTAKRVACAS